MEFLPVERFDEWAARNGVFRVAPAGEMARYGIGGNLGFRVPLADDEDDDVQDLFLTRRHLAAALGLLPPGPVWVVRRHRRWTFHPSNPSNPMDLSDGFVAFLRGLGVSEGPGDLRVAAGERSLLFALALLTHLAGFAMDEALFIVAVDDPGGVLVEVTTSSASAIVHAATPERYVGLIAELRRAGIPAYGPDPASAGDPRHPTTREELAERLRAEAASLTPHSAGRFASYRVEPWQAICGVDRVWVVARDGPLAVFLHDDEDEFAVGVLADGDRLTDVGLVGDLTDALHDFPERYRRSPG